MVWARFDDNWTERREILALTLDQRWHLISMIVYCCRYGIWDGELRAVDARRASDVNDPDSVLAALADAGYLDRTPTGWRIVDIGSHVPSEAKRDQKERDRLRKQRERAHAKGNHAYCAGSKCEVLSNGQSNGQSSIVSGTGTGTGKPTSKPSNDKKKKAADADTDYDDDEWADASPRVIAAAGVVD